VVYSGADQIMEPPYRRDIGMVFQSYAIWPHMNVFANVSFPLVAGRRRLPRRQVREKTMRALGLVHLEDLAFRPAPFLSGGQQQRVALARALVAEPKVLLLDEPLSNLDAKLRAEMQLEIKNLVQSLGVTTLYVTHDQTEALTMSDKVAVMRDGLLVEEAMPRAIYLRPNSAYTATFLGDANLIAGTIVRRSAADGMCQVDTKLGRLLCPAPHWPEEQDGVWVCYRPEGVSITVEDPLRPNVFQGHIVAAIFTGDQVSHKIAVADHLIQAKTDPHSSFAHNAQVFVQLAPEKCLLIRREPDAVEDTLGVGADPTTGHHYS
ncbi:MAG: ABC transporter ATP-binding protein, partial [Acidobacteria bacterium]|nr:ABC transporter ATP-binding protein [Acidobacteriota bacterium]